MAFTFIVNPGSTSRKYALYNDGVCIVVLYCEMTGEGFSLSVIRNNTKVFEGQITAHEFENSVEKVIEYLLEEGDIKKLFDIQKIGVRVVSPGSYFTKHRVIDKKYLHELKDKEDVAPLHIPGLLSEIHAVKKAVPDAIVYGISDSVFHTTIPKHVRTVSIAKADAEKYDIKRFGYHGLSFASVAGRLQEKFGIVPSRTIVCHIGGGVSIAALKDGKSVSTSMGYSPVSGLLMGSRGGDIAAGVVAALTVFKRLRGKKLYEYLYKESGFKGVAGVSDLRVLLERKALCDEDAKLAVDMFVHQMQSWIGRHATQMGGVDAIVLTATASVRNPNIRKLLLSNLSLFDVELDEEKNDSLIGKEGFIHKEGSAVKVLVLKTDEMGEIERECQNL